MRYRLVAQVEGDVKIPGPTVVNRKPFKFEFLADLAGKLNEVAVSVQVPPENVERFASSIGPGQGRSVATYKVGCDHETHEKLVAELQKIESRLGFNLAGALRRIRWDRVKRECIAENEEEGALLPVTALSVDWQYPPVHGKLEYLDLVRATSGHFGDLHVPQAFFLEGVNYFREFHYVQAYYSFYFVIEDFFAGGKTGEGPVLKEFAKSGRFLRICDRQLTAIFKETRHRKRLEVLMNQHGCEPNAKGVPKLLFRVRGNLHHYSAKSSRARATPFNQRDYETVALLTMCIADDAIHEHIRSGNRPA